MASGMQESSNVDKSRWPRTTKSVADALTPNKHIRGLSRSVGGAGMQSAASACDRRAG